MNQIKSNLSLDYLAGISNKQNISQIEALYNTLTQDQQMRVLGYIDSLKGN